MSRSILDAADLERSRRKDGGTQHTPGPWRVGDAGATVFGPPNGTPAPKTVCTLTHSMATGSKRADARLIAAAPELLAALRHVKEYSDKQSAQSAEDGALWAQCSSFARAVIAKAEGRS